MKSKERKEHRKDKEEKEVTKTHKTHKRKTTKRLIAVLLSVIMVLPGLIPVYAFDGDWLEVDGGVSDLEVLDGALIPSGLDGFDSEPILAEDIFQPTDTDATWTLGYTFDIEDLPFITPLIAMFGTKMEHW